MSSRFNSRLLLSLAALGLAAVLGGCVADPAAPGYGDRAPYTSGGYVSVGGGWQSDSWHH